MRKCIIKYSATAGIIPVMIASTMYPNRRSPGETSIHSATPPRIPLIADDLWLLVRRFMLRLLYREGLTIGKFLLETLEEIAVFKLCKLDEMR